MKNSGLKKVYKKIHQEGYEKVYTSVYTKSVVRGEELSEEIKEVLKEGPWKGKKVLDVGCGTGLFAFAAAQRGAKVLAVDYIPEAIQVAQSKYSHPLLKYEVSEASKISGKYDMVVSIGTLEHMDKPFETLNSFKKHLLPDGKIIITSPNWTNPRGYMLQTLFKLFNAPITLADLHYFTPRTFVDWAKRMHMRLKWRTFEFSWAHGEKLLKDFQKRIPNVLRDAKLPVKPKNIKNFLGWIKNEVLAFDHTQKFSGALGIYIFSNHE